MSTDLSDTTDIEERLRAALTARAELVRPEDLASVAPVVPLRPRWQSPWVLLATAAVVLLVLGVVLQGVGGRQRSDDIAPKPDEPRVTLPADVGRDWQADDIATPARLDLDGDDTLEKVDFLAEQSRGKQDVDGRVRLQTTLSSTGEEAWGIADLGSTIGTYPLKVFDADGDGDQELALLHEGGQGGPGAPSWPVVFDLREGLLVEAAVDQPDLLLQGSVVVAGSATEYYDLVRTHSFWFEDGSLFTSRSVDAFARGNMSLYQPEHHLVDAWEWHLDEDGVLRPTSAGCRVEWPDGRTLCSPDEQGDLPLVSPVATGTMADGEETVYGDPDFYSFTARVEGRTLVVEGTSDDPLTYELDLPDARVLTTQPTGIFYDGASFVVTSASDPSLVEVVVQRTEGLRRMEAVGEVPLQNDGDVRTWLTEGGGLVTLVADGEQWQVWSWEMVGNAKIAALPNGTVCFDDVDDPTTVRRC